MKRFLLQLAYSNLWLAFSAGALVYLNQQLLGLPLAWLPCWLGFSVMFFVYSLAKTVHFDMEADFANDPERCAFLLRWRRPLIAACLVVYLQCLVVAHYHGILWLCLFPVLACLLYDIKLLPAGFRYRRLKDVTGVKSLVVAGTWASMAAGLAIHQAPWSPSGLAIGLVWSWSFLLMAFNTIYFDLGDMAGDRLEGTVTLPIYWGFTRCWWFLAGLCLLASLILWLGPMAGLNPAHCHLLQYLSLYCGGCLALASSEESDIGFACDILVDGHFLFGALVVALWPWL